MTVANFDLNYLSFFLIDFKNSCAYLEENFLNFSKLHQLLQLVWVEADKITETKWELNCGTPCNKYIIRSIVCKASCHWGHCGVIGVIGFIGIWVIDFLCSKFNHSIALFEHLDKLNLFHGHLRLFSRQQLPYTGGYHRRIIKLNHNTWHYTPWGIRNINPPICLIFGCSTL